jgi:hypothetical protein
MQITLQRHRNRHAFIPSVPKIVEIALIYLCYLPYKKATRYVAIHRPFRSAEG